MSAAELESRRTSSAKRAVAVRAAVALSVGVVAVVYYVFVVSAGQWSRWPTWMAYADSQAEGFRAGHLHTNITPRPELLKLAEPLSPKNKMRFWHWDYSLSHRQIHTYWGLAPAAFLALAKSLFRIQGPVGDQALVFAFLCGRLLFGILLIDAMAARRTPRPPHWAVAAAMAVFAVATPTTFMLARAAVYEVAIAAGSCFLIAALYFAFRMFHARSERAAGGWLLGASLVAALAGTSRISLFPAGAALLAILVGAPLLEPGAAAGAWPDRWRRVLGRAWRAALPFGAVTLTHLYVNYLRYDAWTEFGQRYQMGKVMSMGAGYIPANLWSYLIRPLQTSCQFPFVIAAWHEKDRIPLRDHLPSWFPIPADYYGGEPAAGLLVAAPFVVLALGLLLPRLLRRPPAVPADEQRRWWWALIAVGVATLAAGLPDLFASASTVRYEGDFTSGVLLLAIAGGWEVLAAPSSRAGRVAVSALFVTLVVVTLTVAVLLGFTGYFEHFARHNPLLWSRLVKLRLCGV